MSPSVPDDEAGMLAGALSAATSTSIPTPLTVDTNSNPALIYSLARGVTPQPNPTTQLSKEDQAALTAVWKQITDPAVEYTQVRTLLPGSKCELLITMAPTAPPIYSPPG